MLNSAKIFLWHTLRCKNPICSKSPYFAQQSDTKNSFKINIYTNKFLFLFLISLNIICFVILQYKSKILHLIKLYLSSHFSRQNWLVSTFTMQLSLPINKLLWFPSFLVFLINFNRYFNNSFSVNLIYSIHPIFVIHKHLL